ncbi:GIY-YIG nuclease family protein [Paenibacillus sp. GCM10028914]|uniref:GIY-YIG nuclease family protein n=1 Tax=Paenibacillus sp. GCM10028914 TaxID=3273416 RepID=UPI00360E92B5
MKTDPQWTLQIEQLAETFMNQTPVEIRTLDRYDFPKKGGVYAFTTIDQDECVYVGKSGDLRDRVFDVHLNGKGKSSFRQALLGLKKTRKQSPVTTFDELDDYIADNHLLRFYLIEDITLRGCLEDYLNALLKPMYSVSLSMK